MKRYFAISIIFFTILLSFGFSNTYASGALFMGKLKSETGQTKTPIQQSTEETVILAAASFAARMGGVRQYKK